LVLGRLEPFENFFFIFEEDGEAALGVGVEFLNLVEAFAEAPE
jgi:hypothetical protein